MAKATVMKPSLTTLDTELALAVAELERTLERIPHGRVTLTLERIGSVTVGHDIAVSRETTADIERVMWEKPMSPGRSG
jgi:hypothetical protein